MKITVQCKRCGHIYGRGTNNPIPNDNICKLCGTKLKEEKSK